MLKKVFQLSTATAQITPSILFSHKAKYNFLFIYWNDLFNNTSKNTFHERNMKYVIEEIIRNLV